MLSVESTGYLYLSIYAITTFLGFTCQRRIKDKFALNKKLFITALFIHWFFLAFTNTGSDYYNYYRQINDASFAYIADDPEILFELICYICKSVFGNPDVGIFFIKSLTVYLFYTALYQVSDKIKIGFAILAYNALMYLQGMLVIAQHLAVVLLLLGLILLVKDKKVLSTACLLSACLVHASAFIVCLMYPIYYIFAYMNKLLPKWALGGMLVVPIVVLRYVDTILMFALVSYGIFEHYENYDLISNYEGSGLMQYLFFVPIFVIIYRIYVGANFDNNFKNIAVLTFAFAFICALVGYKIEVFSRMNVEFLGLYAIIVPLYFSPFSNTIKSKKIKIWSLVWFFYLVLRGYFVFVTNMNTDAGGQLYNYNFFNPFL